MKHLLYLILLGAMTAGAGAAGIDTRGSDPFAQSPKILPVAEAFRMDWIQNPASIDLRFQMPRGYYLYRHAFDVRDDEGNVRKFMIPAGKPVTDEYFGDVEVYYDEVIVTVPLAAAKEVVAIRYQGCAEAGYCYPPQTSELLIESHD